MAHDPATDGQPKRRACDECRSRKLACSKEADGCARCRREGVKCHYSAQKQMGRPRKRAQAEKSQAQPASAPATQPGLEVSQQPSQQLDSQPRQEPAVAQQPLPESIQQPAHVHQFDQLPLFYPPADSATMAMDLDMSFMDVGDQDIDFIDFLGLGDGPAPAIYPQPEQVPAKPIEPPNIMSSPGAGLWNIAKDMFDINFDSYDAPPPPPEPRDPAVEFTAEQFAQFMGSLQRNQLVLEETSPASASSASQHSSPSESSATSSASSAPLPRRHTCSCMTSLYLAMDSLQRLPVEVASAMRVTRMAAKAAHDTILCEVCGNPPLEFADPSHVPTFMTPSFQNLMMLGALLPSISYAYTRILAMVDAEVASATAERRRMKYTLAEYGGIWGQLGLRDEQCGTSALLEGAVVEPTLWRLMVRSLLRLDVYGIGQGSHTCTRLAQVQQPGLKDIINMMEQRSRKRHEELDALIASGAVTHKIPCDYIPLAEAAAKGDKPTCLRIIDIAKKSVDGLIIP